MSQANLHHGESSIDYTLDLYFYRLYGLRLASVLACPELSIDSPGEPDVVVRFGHVQWDSHMLASSYVARKIGPGRLLLNVPGIARFQMENGSRILIEPAADTTLPAIRLFLLGAAMSGILHQRGITSLHASAIATPEGAVIFAAPSGYGKSTLVAALSQRGYPLLADDICALTINDSEIWLHPAYPRVNLLPDALAALGRAPALEGSEEALIRPFSNKYCMPVRQFAHGATPVKTIYMLHPTDYDRVQLQTLYGFARVHELMNSTYGRGYVRELGEEERHLVNLQEIARQVDVVRVERPKEGYRLDELVDAIEADFSRG
jgi:hypothetical protein